MPLLRHFWNLQNWHLFLWALFTWQLPSATQLYTRLFCTVRLKKPLHLKSKQNNAGQCLQCVPWRWGQKSSKCAKTRQMYNIYKISITLHAYIISNDIPTEWTVLVVLTLSTCAYPGKRLWLMRPGYPQFWKWSFFLYIKCWQVVTLHMWWCRNGVKCLPFTCDDVVMEPSAYPSHVMMP